MDTPRFSIVVWTADTCEMYFRDLLESVVAQVYDNWELWIFDENEYGRLQQISGEFFPDDDRVHYRRLRNRKGQAYGYNMGFHFGGGDYFVFVGQHDRLSANTLFSLAEHIVQGEKPGMLYCDHDELKGADRVCPHFKPDFNRELLLRRNYIGNFAVISRSAAAAVGGFREKLSYAFFYDYYLRVMSRGVVVCHIPSLLYHERDLEDVISYVPSSGGPQNVDWSALRRQRRAYEGASYREHRTVIQAFLLREDIAGEVSARRDRQGWNLTYSGDDYRKHRKEYIMLHDPDVRVLTAGAKERMYGYLRQPKVAVVGVGFLGQGFAIDNTGYIFDREGIAYPAFYRHSIFRNSYEHLALCPRDVSMVDFGYCMLNAKIYRRLHGLDTGLLGRDVMLDYCLRAAEAGYRVVVTPEVWASYRTKRPESSRESNEYLKDKHGELLERHDPFYNRNLPMGIENYRLMG